ncbi:LysR family transcriptional regulator [Rhizobium leguminosarum]|uniref:LysR family transcriptional regulator n=1 Tax=Rhizobium leguminosarum TaxID=384 RepID=UPI001FDF0584|nr:LysR family transcriptional regulator [Rhizobium leguminosarum]
MDELGNIKTFIDVVECGSFSAAARRRDTTVSTILRQVKALEDELGVRLLNRTTRSNSLTEPGANFYEHARTVVSELRSAKQEASSFQTTVKGLLRVCLRISASRVILPALPAFLERHPDLVLDVMLSDERLDLVAHKIDVGVWLGHLEDSRIVARRLTPSKRVICASPAYLAKRGVPSTPQEITQHNCIIYQGSIYQDLWRFTKGDEQIDVTVHGNLRTNTSPVLVAAVLSGMGLAVLQEFTVRSALADGTLKQILPEYEVSPTDVDTGVYAVYPNAKGMTRKTRVFVDFLVNLFRRP